MPATKTRLPITAEARGKLRSLKAQLAAQYRRIASTYGNDDFMRHTEALCMKSGKGQDRARVKIVRALGSTGTATDRAPPVRSSVAHAPFQPLTAGSERSQDGGETAPS
jgi:hypothetical protein